MYDYLIVGSGLFGATVAHQLKQSGKSCLVIDKRPNIGGNIYTEQINGIHVHRYGAHIFHTSNSEVWDFVNSFVEFNNFINAPIAISKGKIYNLPFNMNTFHAMWGVTTPDQARRMIEKQRIEAGITEPKNLEEQAIYLIGSDIYHTLIKGYTEKQWGRDATQLPAFIIKRLPVRFTFDNNYFSDHYQGVPIGGYTNLVDKMLSGVEVQLNSDFFDNRGHWQSVAKRVIFTGEIDRFFEYKYGHLEYRSLTFETQLLVGQSNYQGNAVVNYADAEIPYTRIIEHKHFDFGQQPDTVISKEYPKEWRVGDRPYYPINDLKNNELYLKYKALADNTPDVIFGGRLAEYKYYDMSQVIENALKLSQRL